MSKVYLLAPHVASDFFWSLHPIAVAYVCIQHYVDMKVDQVDKVYNQESFHSFVGIVSFLTFEVGVQHPLVSLVLDLWIEKLHLTSLALDPRSSSWFPLSTPSLWKLNSKVSTSCQRTMKHQTVVSPYMF